MLKFYCIFIFSVCLTVASFAEDEPRSFQPRVVVNNRVLAFVNSKAISVVDVMKKMDMILYQYYPQYLENPQARYEFYRTQWKTLLFDLVDKELVCLDAEEKGLQVSPGDVREELEEIFGPQVMINVDSTGLTLEEAQKMIKADITIRRMLYYKVGSRIPSRITPEKIRQSYEEYALQHKGKKEYTWSCITIKGPHVPQSSELSENLYALLTEEKIGLDAIKEEVEKRGLLQEGMSIHISEAYRQKTQELSALLQELFQSMQVESFSRPQMQTSRQVQTTVFRIYYLHSVSEEQLPPIYAMEATLRNDISQKMMQEETANYFQELRKHFYVSKEQIEAELPENFQPFELH